MQIQNPRPLGPLSESSLAEFEQAYGLQLPPEYRAFLLEFNGGVPSPSFFWIVEPTDGSSVNQFYGLHDGPQPLSIHTYAGIERYGIPSHMLPIGDDGVGNSICVVARGRMAGEIHFLDHEVHPYDDPESTMGITRLASSFGEFLASLRVSPEEEQDA
jgi:hypothetical protein